MTSDKIEHPETVIPQFSRLRSLNEESSFKLVSNKSAPASPIKFPLRSSSEITFPISIPSRRRRHPIQAILELRRRSFFKQRFCFNISLKAIHPLSPMSRKLKSRSSRPTFVRNAYAKQLTPSASIPVEDRFN
ncbi:hypothetical protein DPMN_121999 [Dreissena polymorpha]|uniref:Uncharacterized protein n=1 Tax=Dreissena polymorpha TaxID=45954 RepID=A0A9D4GN68_DREPO|nr:hypothetical protein DPMN_121999 [Dreissena polymorpha]